MTAKPRKRTTPAHSREETVAEATAPDKGFCDNHPTVPAVLVTDFPWSAQQRFCLPCVPVQYRYLL